MTEHDIDRVAYAIWLSDVDDDPMLHASWEMSKRDYRRRAVAAMQVLGALA